MKPYLLRNDNEQHRIRLLLVRHYEKRLGRHVAYSEILHGLQEAKAREIEEGRMAV